jgi:hypothetical protein
LLGAAAVTGVLLLLSLVWPLFVPKRAAPDGEEARS